MFQDVPFDPRWGSADDVEKEFHIPPTTLKAAHVAGWVKAVQPTWKDDEHRSQPVYCFNDIQQYMIHVAHKVSPDYVKRFWTYEEILSAAQSMPQRNV